MPRLLYEQRVKIITLANEGHPTRYIASRMGVYQSTVVRTLQRMRETGSVKDKPKTGRPRRFSVRTERKVVRLITSNKCSTAIDIQGKLRTEDNIQVSSETIRQTLQRNGLRSRVKKKNPTFRNHIELAVLPSLESTEIGLLKIGQG